MKTTISAKVSEELAERIDAAKDEGESRSAAIARLLRAGLDAEQSQHSITLPVLLLWFGTIAISAQYATASGLLGPAGLISAAVGIALMNERISDYVNAVRARFTSGEDVTREDTNTDTDADTAVSEN